MEVTIATFAKLASLQNIHIGSSQKTERALINHIMAGAEQLSELLVHCCSMGDPHTLRQIRTEYPEADFNMTTKGGVTLLMHTIIGAGMYFLIQKQQLHSQTHSHGAFLHAILNT